MGFQSQEQRGFQGLFTTVRGATAPRWSAADVRNIDFQFESIKGRAPLERVFSDSAPQYALLYDGKNRYLESDYTDDDFCLNDLSSGSTEFAVRVYVSNLDMNKMVQADLNTRWVIVGSTGNSTDIGLLDGSNVEGWAIMFRRVDTGGDPTVNLEVHFRQTDGVTPTEASMTIQNFQQYWDDKQSTYLIEFAWDRTGSQDRVFRVSKDGASSFATATVTQDISANQENIHLVNTGAFRLTLGSFRDNNGQHSHFFDGTIGQIEIWSARTMTDASTLWLSWNEDDFDTDVTGILELLVQPDSGDGSKIPALGSSSWTNAGVGEFEHHPLPVVVTSSQLVLEQGGWADADLKTVGTDSAKSWMWIVEFNIPEQVLDSALPPWLLTTDTSLIVMTINDGTDFGITIAVGLNDINGDPIGTASVAIANTTFSFDTTYKVAVVIEPKFDGRVTDMRVFKKIGATWTAEGTALAQPGTPLIIHRWYFATDEDQTRTLDMRLGSFRLYNNFAITPTVAADIDTLDTFPGDTTIAIGFPDRLAASFDLSKAETITTETTVDGFARVVNVQDNFSGAFSIRTRPDGGLSAWSALAHVTRGRKPAVFGLWPSIVQKGTQISHFYNFLLSGGVYRYDQVATTGEWLQHRGFGGRPNRGVRGIDHKDRLLLFGHGFCPVKVYPRGTTEVGLRSPGPSIIGQSPTSIDGDGGLDASTTYDFRCSIYNSETDQESNLSKGVFSFFTNPLHDTLSLRFLGFNSRGTDDWDTIRIYRKAQSTGLYMLDSEIPRPDLLPPEGADLDFEIRLPETDLLLQPEEEIDNDQPEPFGAAAIANNTLHTGGGGLQPGWVYYSKVALVESFPPLNTWQLDNDPGNQVMAIIRMFGRIIIIKERGIWGAAEDAGETGRQPAQLHTGRGLASKAGWAQADNVFFWISSDKAVYVSDGLEIQDVSSPSIKATIVALTDAQLASIQAAHDGKNKQVWFLIPTATSGAHRMVLVYNYMTKRWTRYELAADSIQSGHDSVSSAGDFVVVGSGGHAYRMADSDELGALESLGDGGVGSPASFDYDDNVSGTLLKDSDGDIIGVKQAALPGTFADWAGVPVILVTHDTAFDPLSNEYLPPHDEIEAEIYYTYIAGVRSGTDDFVYFGHRVPLNSRRFLWAGYGMQKQMYQSQWISPQGEDRPYQFFGTTFVQDENVADAKDLTMVRHFFDYAAAQTGLTFAADDRSTGSDKSYRIQKRMRRFRYQLIGSMLNRDEELHYRRVMWRYQVRGPARRRGA